MDDSGQRENGRHKVDQYRSIHTQWMMPQPQMKDNHTLKLMAVIAERDKAFHERNMALSEKRAAFNERDMAFLQRDAAIAEQNTAIMERDGAIAALEYARENGMNRNGSPPGCTAPHEAKHIHHYQQQQQHVHPQSSDSSDYPYNDAREMHIGEAYPISAIPEKVVKVRRVKRERKETKGNAAPSKKASRAPRKSKRGGGEDLNKQVKIQSPHDEWGGEDLNKQVSMMEHQDWKDQYLGLNQVRFDDSMMPVPVCSCTGKYQHCYKWGSGGWQSACCTTTLSMYPLPAVPHRRHSRVGGRKMSGGVFTRLLSRLAAEGHDLSTPLDLKDHWAKHGTNRYVTIK